MREGTITQNYPYLQSAFPSSMILPLQDALTVVLPSAVQADGNGNERSHLRDHSAFPDEAVTIKGELAALPSN